MAEYKDMGNDLEFQKCLADIANKTMIGHGIGLGAMLGIFDMMASLGGPQTYEEIAQAGNWKPRYIKEWLNLMVCGHIVTFNKDNQTYYIPKERQLSLTREGKSKNQSIFMGGFGVVARASDELAACFAADGPRGVPYSSYKGFPEWWTARMEVRSSWEEVKAVFKLHPNLLAKMENGAEICDGGCSTGLQAMMIAENMPNSNVTAFDISEHSISVANALCKQKGLQNMKFEVQDACNMPEQWTETFDIFMVWDVVHDVPHSRKMLKEVWRVLKPGGIFFMMDINVHTDVAENIDVQPSPLVYGISLYYCMPSSLYTEGGEGLGAAWGVETQREYLSETGFKDITQLLAEDKFHAYFVACK